MWLVDVNVLVYAFREDAPNHDAYHEWLVTTLRSNRHLGLAEPVLSGFLRITTHPKFSTLPAL